MMGSWKGRCNDFSCAFRTCSRFDIHLPTLDFCAVFLLLHGSNWTASHNLESSSSNGLLFLLAIGLLCVGNCTALPLCTSLGISISEAQEWDWDVFGVF